MKVRFPIGLKLAIIFGIIILVSLGSLTYVSTDLMSKDIQVTAEESNLSLNSRAASTVKDKIDSIRANVFQLLDLLSVISGGHKSANARQAYSMFLERNQDIAAIYVISADSVEIDNPSDDKILNNHFFTSNEIDVGIMDDFLRANKEVLNRACIGETIAVNASPFFSIPTIAMYYPWKENGRDQACVIVFGSHGLSEILGTGSSGNITYVINNTYDLLIHPENDRVIAGENLRNHPLVEQIRENNQNNDDSRQVLFELIGEDEAVVHYYGAYEKIPGSDIFVMTTVELDRVLEGVRDTRKNNLLITAIVFFLSIIIILVFSRFAISHPLRKLSAAADEIQKGNFETDIIDGLNCHRKDEIGVLNQSTKDERGFLNVFAKFTNQGVAKKIATKSLDFEPHLKDITIFFSDIRGFTAISDGFKNKFGNDSPKEIIAFLNDYMSRMVECITLSGGNVDKFEGDAIMAVWGILREENLDFETLPDSDPNKKALEKAHQDIVKADAISAITGTIAMRYALMKYNKDAEIFTKAHENEPLAQYKPHIRIGCGLNTGRATAGIMGSNDKMEYTAIGDPVNFASRTESSNKPCGTDILITEDTYNLLKMDFIRCEENGFTIPKENEEREVVVEMIPVGFDVKGKGVQHFYGVVNMPNFDIEKFFKSGNSEFVIDEDCRKAVGPTGPKTLNEMRNMLGIPLPDFEKVNLNEEENKIQVKQ